MPALSLERGEEVRRGVRDALQPTVEMARLQDVMLKKLKLKECFSTSSLSRLIGRDSLMNPSGKDEWGMHKGGLGTFHFHR